MHRPDTDTELRERLKKLGLRATSTRLAVMHTLHDAAGPLTHEQVMDSPTTRSLDRATVYRILRSLRGGNPPPDGPRRPRLALRVPR